MDRILNIKIMQTIRSKSLKSFTLSTIIVLVIISPLLFVIIYSFYTSDLDEVIDYRIDQFKERQQPLLSHSNIADWNEFNPDIIILPYDSEIKLNKPTQLITLNKQWKSTNIYRAKYVPIKIDDIQYLLCAKLPMLNNKEIIEIIVFQLLVVILFILITQLILYRYFASRISKPLFEILQKLSTFQVNGKSVPEFEQSNIVEYKFLEDKLQLLMRNSQYCYSKQKEFIENVSHEMQTPIAIVQSQLDILLQDPNLTEDQYKIIQSLYLVSTQTKRLNKNLLLLAKIENSQFTDFEEVDLVKKLTQTHEWFKEIALMESIQVHLKAPSIYITKANPTLVDVLLNNLYSNGIKYNTKKGYLTVSLEGKTLKFTNTSDTPALSEKYIFDRFIRKDKSKHGYGLGLTIVKEICMAQGWDIKYEYNNGLHSFIISFHG